MQWSRVGYLCTCARGHHAFVSQERLDRLCSNLVCGLEVIDYKCLPQVIDGVHLHVRMCAPLFHKCSACCFSVTVGPIAFKFDIHLDPISYSLCSSHGWGISARAHVHTTLLYLRNALTDCVQIWYVGWRSLIKCFPQFMGGVGHLCACARAPPSPYLRIRVANCAKIWCVARDLFTRFTRVGGGMTTFARACPVSLSRKPLSPGTKATSKTDLSLSRSLVHRQTWRLKAAVH